MKITVWKKYEIDFSYDTMLECKQNYNENPEDCYDLTDESEFIQCLEENWDLEEYDDIIVEKKDFEKFVNKYKQM